MFSSPSSQLQHAKGINKNAFIYIVVALIFEDFLSYNDAHHEKHFFIYEIGTTILRFCYFICLFLVRARSLYKNNDEMIRGNRCFFLLILSHSISHGFFVARLLVIFVRSTEGMTLQNRYITYYSRMWIFRITSFWLNSWLLIFRIRSATTHSRAGRVYI